MTYTDDRLREDLGSLAAQFVPPEPPVQALLNRRVRARRKRHALLVAGTAAAVAGIVAGGIAMSGLGGEHSSKVTTSPARCSTQGYPLQPAPPKAAGAPRVRGSGPRSTAAPVFAAAADAIIATVPRPLAYICTTSRILLFTDPNNTNVRVAADAGRLRSGEYQRLLPGVPGPDVPGAMVRRLSNGVIIGNRTKLTTGNARVELLTPMYTVDLVAGTLRDGTTPLTVRQLMDWAERVYLRTFAPAITSAGVG